MKSNINAQLVLVGPHKGCRFLHIKHDIKLRKIPTTVPKYYTHDQRICVLARNIT